MKILFIIDSLKSVAGMERSLINKANYFAEKLSHEVHIINLHDMIDEDPAFTLSPKIKVYKLAYLRHSNFLKKLKDLTRLLKIINETIKNRGIECLISLNGKEVFLFPFVNKNVKKIVESHFIKGARVYYLRSINATNIEILLARFKEYIRVKILKNIDAFVVLTKRNKDEWTDLKNVIWIPNSISYDKNQRKSQLINKSVIAVGRLAEVKGFDLLIEAWKKVALKFPEWKLNIYGEGPLENELRKLIDINKLEKIIFLNKFTKDIEQKYLESSIFVLSSRNEGFGLVILEAMSAGLPVVSFDCPWGPREMIEDSKNGFLIECYDTDKMSEKIIALIESKDLRRKLSIETQNIVNKFSNSHVFKSWEEILKL